MLRQYIFTTFVLLTTDVVLCKPDYLFNPIVDGWLKLHLVPATWKEAFQRCHYEGAVLASPVNEKLLTALRTEVTRLQVYHPIFLGIHALYSEGNFFSVEGVPLEDMPIKWSAHLPVAKTGACFAMDDTGPTLFRSDCTETRPYICYKKRENSTNLNECGTFDNNYHLDKRTGSCYKFHNETKAWTQAHMICAAEGSYLVIVNNEEEAKILIEMFPHSDTPNQWEAIHIGLRDLNNDGTWLTIHGESLENVFNRWVPGQPDNYNNNQYCANLVRSGALDDNTCDNKAKFVCEKHPNTTRFGPVDFSYEAIFPHVEDGPY